MRINTMRSERSSNPVSRSGLDMNAYIESTCGSQFANRMVRRMRALAARNARDSGEMVSPRQSPRKSRSPPYDMANLTERRLVHVLELSRIGKLIRDEAGEDLIEYGLLAAFAAAVATAAITTDPLGIKPSLVSAFRRAKQALDNT
jgi:Flp pilus assembly pilin Flp